MSTKNKSAKKILKITEQDATNRLDYLAANHKKLGNLHERMKWLVGCKEALLEHITDTKDVTLFTLFQDLDFAVIDLETELSFHSPAAPPYTRREPSGLGCQIYEHQMNPTK